MPIKFTQKGNFSLFEKYIKRARRKTRLGERAQDIAEACIKELQHVTPKDSGLTSESWDYEIIVTGKKTSIIFNNTNIQNGVNVAILLEYGHATANGVWVEGRDYIDPVIKQEYINAITRTWKEMTKL